MGLLFDLDGVKRSAEISECGKFRWSLCRKWEDYGREVCFVMLNPSTADGEHDDPTIRRCIAFAKAWGYGQLTVRNLYPFRATDPKDLKAAGYPTGGERGDTELHDAACCADQIVCAWGANARPERVARVLEIWEGKTLYCLGTTKDGHPKHPLYIPAAQPLIFYRS